MLRTMIMTALFNFIFLVSLNHVLTSCSSEKVKGKTEAESLYLQAQKAYEKKRYLEATEKLGQLRSQHPYSYYTTSAELLMADIYFAQENYLEAAASYQQFRDLHPKHEQIAYGVFRQAESLFLQMPATDDRDLSNGEESLKYYQEMLTVYASSAHAAQAKLRVEEILRRLKAKDLYVLNFYLKTGEYEGALWRANHLLEKYAEHSDVVKAVWPKKIASHYHLKQYSECLEQAKLAATGLGDSKEVSEELKLVAMTVEDCASAAKSAKEHI